MKALCARTLLRWVFACLSGCVGLLGCHWFPYQYEDARYRVTEAKPMPAVVSEGSGLVMAADTEAVWTLNDGGGQAALYRVSRQGRLLQTLPVPNSRNVDWEELTRDRLGNLYVGDFGNNWNMRRDLRIYRIHPKRPHRTDAIAFQYADQRAFPPSRQQKNFDCEAFFWYHDSLYLFSKNRGDRQVKLYVLPATPGRYVAQVRERAYLEPPAEPYGQRVMVTAAAMSPDGQRFALLTYGNVYLFGIKNGTINFRYPYWILRMNRHAIDQVEAIAFLNNHDFLFTNELGKVFEARRK